MDDNAKRAFYKNEWGLDDETINAVLSREMTKQDNYEVRKLAIARHNESHRKDFLPSHIIDEAERSGFYKSMETSTVFDGQSYIEDQMTGVGHIEGQGKGDAIGYFASVEMRNGYRATIYVPADQIKTIGNPERYTLSVLIKMKGLQNYVKPDSND
jgi:hypothetical protein